MDLFDIIICMFAFQMGGLWKTILNQIYQEIILEVQISENLYQMHSLMSISPWKSWWVYSLSTCTSGFICSVSVSCPAWLLTLVMLPVELISINTSQLHHFVNCIRIVNQAEPLGVLTDRLYSINKCLFKVANLFADFPWRWQLAYDLLLLFFRIHILHFLNDFKVSKQKKNKFFAKYFFSRFSKSTSSWSYFYYPALMNWVQISKMWVHYSELESLRFVILDWCQGLFSYQQNRRNHICEFFKISQANLLHKWKQLLWQGLAHNLFVVPQ